MRFDIIFNKSVVLVRGFKGNILCFFYFRPFQSVSDGTESVSDVYCIETVSDTRK
jgi:hypothetical protein